MNFELSKAHKQLRERVYNFARSEVLPIIKEHDRNATYPFELLPKMAAQGFFGICLPKQYGGQGLDYISLGIVSEGLEWADSSVRETIAVHLALHALSVFHWGTETQKQKFLPPLAGGEHIACFGLTEPGAGSDWAVMLSTARKEGEHYILNGTKRFITLADVADRLLVFAKTEPDKGARGITAFILESR